MNLLRRRMMIKKEEVPLNADLAEIFGAENNKILLKNGELGNWSAGIVSGYIPCKANDLYELKTTCSTWEKVCFYDSNKIFVSESDLGGYGSGTFQFGKGTKYEIPDTASCFRCQLKGTDEGDYYIMRIA